MSHWTVREKFEAEIKLFLQAQVPPIEFYDTINVAEEIRDDVWVTAEYFADYIEPLCYAGSKRAEYGSIDVSIFVKAGTGSKTAVELADALEEHFNGRDLDATTTITSSSGADDITAGDARPMYGVGLVLEYQQYR